MHFVLTIERVDRTRDEFRVGPCRYTLQFDDAPARTFTIEWDGDLDLELRALDDGQCTPNKLQRMSERLYRLLEAAGWPHIAGSILGAAQTGADVVVDVRLGASELFGLPWELLTDVSGAFLGERENVLIRYADTDAARPDSEQRPEHGRVLLAWANDPAHRDECVPWQEHGAAIAACVPRFAFDRDRDRDVLAHVSGARLRERLAADPSVQIVHILCHGKLQPDDHHTLVWVDDEGSSDPTITVDALRACLAPFASQLRLVVLCACRSAGQLGNRRTGFAQMLHRLGIEYVIGAHGQMVAGAREFARSFYENLGETDVESAFRDARRALRQHRQHRKDWHRVRLFARMAPRARLWDVPELPTRFLDRPTDRERVIEALFRSASGKPVGIAAERHGLHGMGGIGKTVLATTVARDDAIRERFADGVYWLTVGQEPQLTTLQAQLARALGMADTAFDSLLDGKRKLTAALTGKRALLVLDDVWHAAHAEALEVVGQTGRILITTRNLDVLSWRGAEAHALDIMTGGQARALLATWTGATADSLPAEASDVAEACGRLPLALAIAGSLVGKPGGSWARVLRLLQTAKLDKLRGQMPAYPYRNVYQAIAASVSQLAVDDIAEHAEQCYADLAVFPEDEDIPASALNVLWGRYGLDADDVHDLASALASYSLATVYGDEAVRLRLHDIQRAYVRACQDDIPALHSAFVDAYAETCRDGDLARGPAGEDAGSYFFARLPYHLIEADRAGELRGLLGRYAWLAGKLHACGVAELIADFERIDSLERGLALIRDALRLSSHVLARDGAQLPGQLIGRLGLFRDEVAAVRELLDSAHTEPTQPWLCPLVANLTPPGGPLLRTFAGHSSPVWAVALNEDGKRALSGSHDHTLKFLDACRPCARNPWNHSRSAFAASA